MLTSMVAVCAPCFIEPDTCTLVAVLAALCISGTSSAADTLPAGGVLHADSGRPSTSRAASPAQRETGNPITPPCGRRGTCAPVPRRQVTGRQPVHHRSERACSGDIRRQLVGGPQAAGHAGQRPTHWTREDECAPPYSWRSPLL